MVEQVNAMPGQGVTSMFNFGQTFGAIKGVCAALDKNDIVLSNHRCHGHFLSHTKNYDGLLNEILGKKTGVCGGVGGSQHLSYKKTFYSKDKLLAFWLLVHKPIF